LNNALAHASQSGKAVALQPSIRLAQISPLLETVAKDGVDTDTILSRYGIEKIEEDHTSIPLVDYFRIERDIARALDDLTAHLSTRRLTYQTGEFVLEQIKKATTLADAIASLADYFNMMHGGTYNTVTRTAQSITLVIDDQDFPYSVREHTSLVRLIGECVQIKVHCLLDSLSEGLAAQALRRTSIVRRSDTTEVPHLSFWPRPPQRARQTYSLTYDMALANQSIPKPEALDLSSDGIFSRVINHLEKTGFAHRDQRFAERALDIIEGGHWQQENVAERLRVSVATLRRRLAEEGTSFRQLVQENRLKRAEVLLHQGHSIQYVTDALSYSDIRSFNRAFKRWKGTTPAAFAKQQSEPA